LLFGFDGNKIAIDSIFSFKTDTATKVYNLKVAGNNDYYVSNTKVLVHNQCKNSSPNQFRQLISKDKAPKSIEAIGTEGRMPHIHFKGNSALYIDGTWKHGIKKLTNK
jgi:hypothetical protein